MGPARSAAGFSIVELLVVILVTGIVAGMAVPQLLMAYERTRQRATLADMRAIGMAAGTYRVDHEEWPSALEDLDPDFLQPVPGSDAWGNDWSYEMSEGSYTLTSYGSDGNPGPEPPDTWRDEPVEADLILADGVFVQSPNY
ncbi:MAG: prepilin-type N-terminal cleavage/methylation domain-containing protein [Acidobacteriota bacterium]